MCPRLVASSVRSSRLKLCRWLSVWIVRPLIRLVTWESTPERWRNWVNAWRKKNPDPATATEPVEAARVAGTHAEIRRPRMGNEFLKKAAAFFARTQP